SVRRAALWAASLPSMARGGRVLAYNRIRQILDAPVYVARPTAGVEDVLGRPRSHWPALVDDSTWQRVQARIAHHKHMPRQASGHYLLTGLLRCPRCGGRLNGWRRQARASRYRCFSGGGARGANATAPHCTWGALAATFDHAVLDAVGPMIAIVTETNPVLLAALRRRWRALQ